MCKGKYYSANVDRYFVVSLPARHSSLKWDRPSFSPRPRYRMEKAQSGMIKKLAAPTAVL